MIVFLRKFIFFIKQFFLLNFKSCIFFYKRSGLLLPILACFLMAPIVLNAQPPAKAKPARILFLVDASSSMLNKWQNEESRFHAASRIMEAVMDSIHAVNNDVAFALRVFGSQYPAQDKNCYDSKLEVSFNYNNSSQIITRLKYIRPEGFSPIAWSLQQAAENDFIQSDDYAYSIILITDGGESCGGDICATYQALLSRKISFKPYILSLVDYGPLRKEYDCLGQYLLIAREKDIAPAIKKIIGDNRQVLSIKRSGLQPLPLTSAPVIVSRHPLPEPVKTAPPTKEPPVKAAAVKAPEPKPVVKKPVPLPEMKRTTIVLKKLSVYDKPFRMNLLYTIARAEPVPLPDLPPLKIIIPEDTTSVSITPKHVNPVATRPLPVEKPVIEKPGKLVYTTMTEDAAETTLKVYFTDGKGKFYRTEPKMIFQQSGTGKPVKTIYRNMAGDEPAPIKIAAGNYDIIIPGSKATAINVKIEDHKANKVYIKAGNGSLAFYYPSSPNEPVKEYLALVSKPFEGGPVVKQPCSEILPYAPANYHIEINTLPPLMYNIDLNFNEEKLVAIPKPGTIQITNTEAIGKVQFWYQLGSGFVPFLNMEIKGNPKLQHANILPGRYQVRYFKLPVKPYQKAEVVPFTILSDQITNIHLQP
jgi:hypothetical protein